MKTHNKSLQSTGEFNRYISQKRVMKEEIIKSVTAVISEWNPLGDKA